MIDVINRAIEAKLRSYSFTGIVNGLVESIEPLKIRLNDRIVIGQDFIEPKSLGITDNSPSPALPFIIGDKIQLIRYNNGQRFYVLGAAGGAVGPEGPMGPVGPIGPKGETGAQGIQGATGATGATGPEGPVGPVGPQGPQGLPGEKGVNERVPIGTITDFPGDIAPNGWLIMGPDYSRTAYPELFAVIGTKFGAGDGSTTFGTNVKGRVFVGLDTSQTEFNTIGKIGGHKLLQAHTHNVNFDQAWAFGGTKSLATTGGGPYGGAGYVASSGGGDSQNLQPYIVTNKIIKAFNVTQTEPTSTVIDNLTTSSPTDSLSAYQGKILNEKIINAQEQLLWSGILQSDTALTILNLNKYKYLRCVFSIYSHKGTSPMNTGGSGNTLILDLTNPDGTFCRAGVVIPYFDNTTFISNQFFAIAQVELSNNTFKCYVGFAGTINKDNVYSCRKIYGVLK